MECSLILYCFSDFNVPVCRALVLVLYVQLTMGTNNKIEEYLNNQISFILHFKISKRKYVYLKT
jgi:hypothetical protein